MRPLHRLARAGLALGGLLLLNACAAQPALHPRLTNYDAVAGWAQDDHAQALEAFNHSCAMIAKAAPAAVRGKGLLAAPASVWQELCAQAQQTEPEQARAFFETQFVPFYPGDEGTDGLFTGYYEPLLSGARARSERFRFPVYGMPKDLAPGVAYDTRAQIDAGSLAGRAPVLLWVEDEVALFFAHIQGSAQVRLESGDATRIGFAGKNNRAYVAIGKVLREAGELTELNMFTIREWLRAHPERAQAVMHANPSYVFFRELPPAGGPIGAQKVALTPERSLAVDPAFIPYGLPLFIQTELPDAPGAYHRLLIAQDTGGAIKGPIRGDIFFGAGERAEWLAGMMQGRGVYVLLVPRAIASGL